MTEDEIKMACIAGFIVLMNQLVDWVKKELKKRQEIRHKKMESELQYREKELLIKQEEAKKYRMDNMLDDIMGVQHTLKRIRSKLDAKIVTLSAYHNGIAKGFRNYSIRYEEPRDISDSIYERYQSKPLIPYYKAIKQFTTNDYLAYLSEKEYLDNNNSPINTFKTDDTQHMVVYPLLCRKDIEIVPEEHKIMLIKKGNVSYYILGIVTVILDDKSNNWVSSQINPDIKSILDSVVFDVDDIMNIYEKNFKILG